MTYHVSRGSMQKYTIIPKDRDAKADGTGTENYVKQQRKCAKDIGRVVVASQQFGEMLRNIIMNRIHDSRKVDVKAINVAVWRAFQKMLSKYPFEKRFLERIINENNIIEALNSGNEEVVKILCAMKEGLDEQAQDMMRQQCDYVFSKRLQGYFANQFFHYSGIAKKMGLNVDKMDKPIRKV